jgi:hypothetical protein
MARVQIIDKDKGFKKLTKEIQALNGVISKIGFFGDGDSPVNNIAYRASILEFGTKDRRIRPRPFQRNAFDKQNNDLFEFSMKLYNKLLAGQISTFRYIRLLNEWYVSKIINEIRNGVFLPLSPITIARKGSTKPLIDKGIMIGSVRTKVEKR